MFFTLSKTLWFIVDPGNLFIIVLTAGVLLLWTSKARLGRALVSLALLGALLLAVFPIGAAMMGMLERLEPMPEKISGIIVLGGVLNQFIAKKRGSTAPNIAPGRFAEFVRLAKQYPDARLVFAGGWRASLTLGMARLLIRSGLAPLVFAPVARQLGGGVTSVRLEV